jgi:hypothetical protein
VCLFAWCVVCLCAGKSTLLRLLGGRMTSGEFDGVRTLNQTLPLASTYDMVYGPLPLPLLHHHRHDGQSILVSLACNISVWLTPSLSFSLSICVRACVSV